MSHSNNKFESQQRYCPVCESIQQVCVIASSQGEKILKEMWSCCGCSQSGKPCVFQSEVQNIVFQFSEKKQEQQQ